MKTALFALAFCGALAAQTPPRPVLSPEVDSARRVTFRLRAPNAQEVFVGLEGAPRIAMTKDDAGVWTATTEALEPDLYGYSFVVDGVSLIDPGNPLMKPNLLNSSSMVHVPSPDGKLPWEIRDVPRGQLHRHFYKSGIVGDHRDYFVYTPPGYNATAKTVYPVLYLLHGFSDDASGWTSVGRAHVILDNLLAAGKVKPMLVVMTLGYGEPQILSRTAPRTPDMNRRNLDRFRESLIAEVIPAVERDYRAARDRSLRAIAGLSMGGGESLYTGLNNIDKFAYVGAFSAGGGSGPDYAAMYPGLDGKSAARLKGLWIACGRDDRLIESNKKFLEWLKSKDVKFTWTETGGAHTWMVWRRYLADFTPLLFR